MAAKKKNKIGGKELFTEYFSELYGERWEGLYNSLISEGEKIVLTSPFEQLDEYYELDQASKVAADSLPLESGDRILDMCAAPGGKSLCMIYALKGDGDWVLNEYSKTRVQRLKRVVKQFVPEELLSKIKVTNHDATRWGLFEKDAYDKILLDAPCSGEQHLLKTPKELEAWSVKRSKRLVQRQYALLCAAIQALKLGGVVLYSTCSINPMENDDLIAHYQKKKGDVEVLAVKPEIGELTKYGCQIFPDKYPGRGPLYFSLLRKFQ